MHGLLRLVPSLELERRRGDHFVCGRARMYQVMDVFAQRFLRSRLSLFHQAIECVLEHLLVEAYSLEELLLFFPRIGALRGTLFGHGQGLRVWELFSRICMPTVVVQDHLRYLF